MPLLSHQPLMWHSTLNVKCNIGSTVPSKIVSKIIHNRVFCIVRSMKLPIPCSVLYIIEVLDYACTHPRIRRPTPTKTLFLYVWNHAYLHTVVTIVTRPAGSLTNVITWLLWSIYMFLAAWLRVLFVIGKFQHSAFKLICNIANQTITVLIPHDMWRFTNVEGNDWEAPNKRCVSCYNKRKEEPWRYKEHILYIPAKRAFVYKSASKASTVTSQSNIQSILYMHMCYCQKAKVNDIDESNVTQFNQWLMVYRMHTVIRNRLHAVIQVRRGFEMTSKTYGCVGRRRKWACLHGCLSHKGIDRQAEYIYFSVSLLQ